MPFSYCVFLCKKPWYVPYYSLLFPGDVTQIDLQRGQKSGLIEAQKILSQVKGIAFTQFSSQDVVRHPLVQKIINAYENYKGE